MLSSPSLVLYPLGVAFKGILSMQHLGCSHIDFLGNFREMIPEIQNAFFPLLVLVHLAGTSKASLTLWSFCTDICQALRQDRNIQLCGFSTVSDGAAFGHHCFCRVVVCLKPIALKESHLVRNCSSCPVIPIWWDASFLNHCNLVRVNAQREHFLVKY